MKRRIAALAALPVLTLSLAVVPAAAAVSDDPRPMPKPHPGHAWICTERSDISLDLGGLLNLDILLPAPLHPYNGHWCGWVRLPD